MTNITDQLSEEDLKPYATSKPVINDTAQFAVEKLRQYAKETGNLLGGGTSDLSPLEEWLIIQLFESQKKSTTRKACENIGNVGLRKEIACPDCDKTAILIEKPISILDKGKYVQIKALSYLCTCGAVFSTTESDTETMKRVYSFMNIGKNIISPIDSI